MSGQTQASKVMKTDIGMLKKAGLTADQIARLRRGQQPTATVPGQAPTATVDSHAPVTTVEELRAGLRLDGVEYWAKKADVDAAVLRTLRGNVEAGRLGDPAYAATPIGQVAPLAPDVEQRLRQAGITTRGELWTGTSEAGLARIARVARMPERDLLRVFAAYAVDEPKQTWSAWYGRWWLDGVRALTVVVLVGLFIVGMGWLDWALPPWWTSVVMTATRDLELDRKLHGGDVARVRVLRVFDYFSHVDHLGPNDDVNGLVVGREIAAGQFIRVDDLLRQQVVATRDLGADVNVPREAVAVAWSPYRREAVTDPSSAIGRAPRRAIKAGEVVQADLFGDAGAPTGPYVVVADGREIRAFQRIVAQDLAPKSGPAGPASGSAPAGPSSLVDPAAVVGRYPFRSLAAGTVLREDQLGPGISDADAQDRALLSFPVKAGTFNPDLGPGDRVTLIFTSRAASPATSNAAPPTPMLRDVLVMAVQRQGDAVSLVGAVRSSEVTSLGSTLVGADVAIVQSLPVAR